MFRKVFTVAALIGMISVSSAFAQGSGNSQSTPTAEFNNSVVVEGGLAALPMKSDSIRVASDAHLTISGGGGA